MYSGSSMLACLLLVLSAQAADLRVCADPGNMPFSNQRAEGFENALARLAAHNLNRPVRFVWVSQHGRYLKNSLLAGRCDVVMGVPAGLDRLATTRPYYRSSYVFVWRRGHEPAIRSFDDRALRTARIGVQVMQNDHDMSPAARLLATRGLARNIVWYKLYPDFSRPNPPAALIEAVERNEVDVAVAWGPMAGYFAAHAPVVLDLHRAQPQNAAGEPLAFNISMGVRRGDVELLKELNAFIVRRRPEIRRILRRYGVPLAPEAEIVNGR